MKTGDKVIVYGYIDGYSYETTGQINHIIALETGERVEVPIECVIKKEQVVKKDEIKLKDVIRRINRLDENSRTYWLDTILNWFSLDFGLTKYRQGYEQGKLEGELVGSQLKDADKIRQELNKPVIPQFVAEIIEYYKKQNATLYDALREKNFNKQYSEWLLNEQDAYDKVARAWLDGYEVEAEKRYTVVMKETKQPLYYNAVDKKLFFSMGGLATKFTRKELEESGFGWVFDCPGIEIEEVK